MPVYALVELAVSNREGLSAYVEAVPATIAAHGGRYLVRGGNPEVVEGSLGEFPRKVILEFPTMEAAKRWYDSEEYQAILPHRTQHSKCNFIWLEGI